MRLDKYLADMSVGTRSEVKKLIQKGKILVNGEIIKDSSYQIKENDNVQYDGKIIEYVEYEYYVLNKPSGYLSATFDLKDKTIMELIKSKRKDLAPIGRLDKDSEGLIIITNDGQLNHYLTSPNSDVKKKYYVELENTIIENAKEIFAKPMDLGDFVARPAEFEYIDEHSCYLTISEGKFHQVKRMFEKLDNKVTYLKRVKFKNLTLDNLDIGEYRQLTKIEIEDLKN